MLTRESPGWESTTYWIIDGASYHKSESSLTRLRQLGMQVIVAGPYGFLASPCEMVFAYLKQIDLNPHNGPTGKR